MSCNQKARNIIGQFNINYATLTHQLSFDDKPLISAMGKRARAVPKIRYTRANCLFEISYLQVCQKTA